MSRHRNRKVYCGSCGAQVLPAIDTGTEEYCWMCDGCGKWWSIEIDPITRKTIHETHPGTSVKKEGS